MNENLSNEFSWKIAESNDTTMYQLHNGILVDVQAMPSGKYHYYVYRNGNAEAANAYRLVSPIDLIENLKDLNQTRPFA